MTDYANLIKGLHEKATQCDRWYAWGNPHPMGDLYRDAAYAVEALTAEVTRYERERQYHKSAAVRAEAKVEVLTAERDEARAILVPGDDAHLGKLIASLRSARELDEGGYCVLCGMHYTDQETLAHDRMRADAAEADMRAAEADRDRLAAALREIEALAVRSHGLAMRRIAREALAATEDSQ